MDGPRPHWGRTTWLTLALLDQEQHSTRAPLPPARRRLNLEMQLRCCAVEFYPACWVCVRQLPEAIKGRFSGLSRFLLNLRATGTNPAALGPWGSELYQ